MSMPDLLNIARGGVIDNAEWENGQWRYRVRTQRMAFVAAFREDGTPIVITAWRVR